MRTSSYRCAQAERDAALWLLACVLALWTPPEPEPVWQPGLALPHEDADVHMPRVDDLVPLYGMMRQVRAIITFALPMYFARKLLQPRVMQGLGLLGRQHARAAGWCSREGAAACQRPLQWLSNLIVQLLGVTLVFVQLGGALVEARPPADAAAAVAAVTDVLEGALRSHHWCAHGMAVGRLRTSCMHLTDLYIARCNSHCKCEVHWQMGR